VNNSGSNPSSMMGSIGEHARVRDFIVLSTLTVSTFCAAYEVGCIILGCMVASTPESW